MGHAMTTIIDMKHGVKHQYRQIGLVKEVGLFAQI